MTQSRVAQEDVTLPDRGRYPWPFEVRHYELNRSGCVRPEVYLNWLQEAGILASARAGYPLERYAGMECFCLEAIATLPWPRLLSLTETACFPSHLTVQHHEWDTVGHVRMRAIRTFPSVGGSNGLVGHVSGLDWTGWKSIPCA